MMVRSAWIWLALVPLMLAGCGLAVDGPYVFFTDTVAGTIDRVPVNATTVTALVTGQDGPDSVTVLNGMVYWANKNGGTGGTVMKVPEAGGVPATLSGADTERTPTALTTDGQCIYWVDTATGVARVAPP